MIQEVKRSNTIQHLYRDFTKAAGPPFSDAWVWRLCYPHRNKGKDPVSSLDTCPPRCAVSNRSAHPEWFWMSCPCLQPAQSGRQLPHPARTTRRQSFSYEHFVLPVTSTTPRGSHAKHGTFRNCDRDSEKTGISQAEEEGLLALLQTFYQIGTHPGRLSSGSGRP